MSSELTTLQQFDEIRRWHRGYDALESSELLKNCNYDDPEFVRGWLQALQEYCCHVEGLSPMYRPAGRG